MKQNNYYTVHFEGNLILAADSEDDAKTKMSEILVEVATEHEITDVVL